MRDLFELADLFITVRDKELRAFNRVIFTEGHLSGIRGAKKEYLSLIAEMDRSELQELERMKRKLRREAKETGSVKKTRLRVSGRTNGGDIDDGRKPAYSRFSILDEFEAWRSLHRKVRQPAWNAA